MPLTRGAIDHNGRLLSIYDKTSSELLRLLIEGYLPELSNPQALLTAIGPQMQYLRPIAPAEATEGEALSFRTTQAGRAAPS